MLRQLLPVLFIGATVATSEILKWNGFLLDCFRNVSINPPAGSRQLAMLHVAQFEAANCVADLYEPYLVNSGLLAGLSADPVAAAAQAAHDIMEFLYPSAASVWDAELALSLAPYSGDVLDQSVDIGSAVAGAIIANRTGDGSASAGTGWTLPAPLDDGIWRPTPPANATYLLPNWRLVAPWGIPDVEEIASLVLPPELFSTQYEAETTMVRQLGASVGSTRSATQSLIARVWAAGGGTVTPPGQWFQIAHQIVNSTSMSFMQQAQTFARLGMAVADAAIVCWATKYNTQRWRPVTAIRFQGYSNWSSYITTPPFPAHTSGHSSFSGAAATVLRRQTGKNKHAEFTIVAGSDWRTLTNLAAAAEEAAWSRVYGGIHYESDSADGTTIGEEIGTYIAKYVIPLKGELESTTTVEETSNSTSNSTSSDSTPSTTTTTTPSSRTSAQAAGIAVGIVAIFLALVLYYILGGAARKQRSI